MNNTLSVFCEEFGQPSEMTVDRAMIGSELGLNTLNTDRNVPLLMLITEHLKRSRADYHRTQHDSMLDGNSVESIPTTEDDK